MKTPIRIAVTGAAGQIGYALVFRLASGEVFGPDQPVIVQMIEIPPVLPALDGVQMELDDCAFPTLAGVVKADSDHLEDGFADCNFVLCVGSVPRKQGMERGDLIRVNGPIFTSTGQAIQAAAASDVHILVVGNPCNTNCLIAMHNAPGVPRDRWYAMTRLDQNRAAAQLALKGNAHWGDVKNVIIWGNHSNTQFPDWHHATIAGRPAAGVINDGQWLREEFIQIVQERGKAVIEARGHSSAFSAANAAINHCRSLYSATPRGEFTSICVKSDGSYGIAEGIICSFPCTTDGNGGWQIVSGLEMDSFANEMIQKSVRELTEERETVADLLG